MNYTADTCIIGGGVMGLASAYYLTRAGKKVVLLEKNAINEGATGACDDMIFFQSKKPGVPLTMALESLEIYRGLGAELGAEIGFETRGGMVLIEDERQLAVMEKHVAMQKACGLELEIIDRKALREKQPFVSESIIASTYCPVDSQADPLRLTRALLARSLEKGMTLLRNKQPLAVTQEGHWRIAIEDGMVEADSVLIAAGAWSGQVGELFGVTIPVEPRRGQLAVTEQIPALGESNVWTAAYIASKLDKSLMPNLGPYASEIGLGFSFTQTADGNYLVGSTRESAGFDKATSMRAIGTVMRQARHYFPILSEVAVIRTIAGFRPASPDSVAIVGDVDGKQGLFVATGHEGDGVALAPITGKLVADMIGGRPYDKAKYGQLHLRRFTKI